MKVAGKTQVDIDKEKSKSDLEAAILVAQKYLDDTDYQLIRAFDTGEEVSSEVKIEREAARRVIRDNRATLLE